MGYEHQVVGRKAFEAFVREVKVVGAAIELISNPTPAPAKLCRDLDTRQPLRCAEFRHPNWGRSVRMIVEEILAVDDKDCDGASVVSIIIYRKGQRPATPSIVLKD